MALPVPFRSPSATLQLWGGVLAAATAFVVLAFGLKKPYDNWDMVGYVASAFGEQGVHGMPLNTATYDAIRHDVSGPTFRLLTEGDDYRATVYRDPVALGQQLPFYSIRVLYVRAVRAVSTLGIGYARATSVVSAVFASLSVLWLGAFCRALGLPLITVPPVAAIAGFIEVARLSTPDAMAAFFALWTVYGVLRRSRIVLILAAVLPLVRTDFLLLSFLVLGYAATYGRKRYVVASATVATAVCLLDVRMHGGYGWATLFNMSLIGKSPYPASLVPSHALGDYLRPYASMAYGLTMHPHFAVYALAVCCLALRKAEGPRGRDAHVFYALFAIPMAFVAIHLVLFPADTYRFFVFAAALVALWLANDMQAPRGWDRPPRVGRLCHAPGRSRPIRWR